MTTSKSSLAPVIDPIEIGSRLTLISVQVLSLPSIESDDQYNLAYEIRSRIKSAVKFIHSRTKPNIKRWNEGHKASLAEERELVKPFDDLDSQLDEMMLEWNRKKKELEAKLKLERDKDLLEISEAILLEDDVTSDSEVKGLEITTNTFDSFNSLLPAFIPEKPRGERVYKKIKILDINKFNPNFITFLLSDPDIQDFICTWLKKQSKLLGGFEALLSLSGEGSIEQVDEETISIR